VAIRRIDEMLARSERRNAEAHERFEAEDKRLLTAQILMNGAMQKMAVAMEETTGKLDALINTVDGIIRPKGTL
jgi:phosphoribosyl-dephospho-CoA transferase